MGLEKKPCAFGVRCSAAHKEAHNLLTMSLSPAIDPCLCPLCGQPNSCAMACAPHPEAPDATSQPAQAEPCWCTRVQFSAHLLQQVPEAAKNKAPEPPGLAVAIPFTPRPSSVLRCSPNAKVWARSRKLGRPFNGA